MNYMAVGVRGGCSARLCVSVMWYIIYTASTPTREYIYFSPFDQRSDVLLCKAACDSCISCWNGPHVARRGHNTASSHPIAKLMTHACDEVFVKSRLNRFILIKRSLLVMQLLRKWRKWYCVRIV